MTARALSPVTAPATASAGQIISPLRLSHLEWVGAGREPTLRLLVIQLPVFYGSGLLGAESERPSLGLANPLLSSQPPPLLLPKPSCCGDRRLFPSFVFKLICKSFSTSLTCRKHEYKTGVSRPESCSACLSSSASLLCLSLFLLHAYRLFPSCF